MPGVTKEQITQAREWDLLSCLQAYEPQELKKCGSSGYRTASHNSLEISNGKMELAQLGNWREDSSGSSDKSTRDGLCGGGGDAL